MFLNLAGPKPQSSAAQRRRASPCSRGRSRCSSRSCSGRASRARCGTTVPGPRRAPRCDEHSLSHRTYSPGHFHRSCPGTAGPGPPAPTAAGQPWGEERGGAGRPPRPILGDAGMFTGLAGAAGGGEQVGAVAGACAALQEPR